MNSEQQTEQKSNLTSAPSEGAKTELSALYDSMPYEDDHNLTCESCGGSGADSWEAWNPCGACDGEGYRWWE